MRQPEIGSTIANLRKQKGLTQEELALYHPKDIKRQEKQNKYYDTL